MKSSWIIPPTIPPLRPAELHVWQAHRRHHSKSHGSTLAETDYRRMQRFRFAKDRQLFTTSHHLLRLLLGAYSNMSPRQVGFGFTANGKPFLALDDSQRPVEFNLSHSGDIILIAIAYDVPFRVDVEHIQPLPALDQSASHYFSKGEQRQVESLAGDEKLLAFYQCWTRKESVIKAVVKDCRCRWTHFK